MIKHIVCWKLNDQINKEEIQNEIKEKLMGLKEKISQIKFIEVGVNSPLASSDNHDIILITRMDSFDDLAIYQEHPAHKEVGSFIRRFTRNRVAVDFQDR